MASEKDIVLELAKDNSDIGVRQADILYHNWVVFDGVLSANVGASYDIFPGTPNSISINKNSTIPISNLSRIIYESSDIPSNMTPNLISQFAILAIPSQQFDPGALLSRHFSTWPHEIANNYNLFKCMLDAFTLPLVEDITQVSNTATLRPAIVCNNTLSLFRCLLDDFGTGFGRLTIREQLTWMTAAFTFATIWSACGSASCGDVTVADGIVRDTLLRRGVMRLQKSTEWSASDEDNTPISFSDIYVPVPLSQTVFNFYFNKRLLKWMPWSDAASDMVIGSVHRLGGQTLILTKGIVITSFFTHILSFAALPLMISGRYASGKSAAVSFALDRLSRMSSVKKQAYWRLVSTSQSSSSTLYSALSAQSSKRGGRLTKTGSTTLLIEDLNVLENLGTNSFLDALREMVDSGSLSLEREDIDLQDYNFMCTFSADKTACITSNMRFYRHFLHLDMKSFDDENDRLIMIGLMNHSFPLSSTNLNGLFKSKLIEESLNLHNILSRSETWSDRRPEFVKADLFRMLFSLTKMIDGNLTHKAILEAWWASSSRIYRDRCVQDKSRLRFDETLKGILESRFSLKLVSAANVTPLFNYYEVFEDKWSCPSAYSVNALESLWQTWTHEFVSRKSLSGASTLLPLDGVMVPALHNDHNVGLILKMVHACRQQCGHFVLCGDMMSMEPMIVELAAQLAGKTLLKLSTLTSRSQWIEVLREHIRCGF